MIDLQEEVYASHKPKSATIPHHSLEEVFQLLMEENTNGCSNKSSVYRSRVIFHIAGLEFPNVLPEFDMTDLHIRLVSVLLPLERSKLSDYCFREVLPSADSFWGKTQVADVNDRPDYNLTRHLIS